MTIHGDIADGIHEGVDVLVRSRVVGSFTSTDQPATDQLYLVELGEWARVPVAPGDVIAAETGVCPVDEFVDEWPEWLVKASPAMQEDGWDWGEED